MFPHLQIYTLRFDARSENMYFIWLFFCWWGERNVDGSDKFSVDEKSQIPIETNINSNWKININFTLIWLHTECMLQALCTGTHRCRPSFTLPSRIDFLCRSVYTSVASGKTAIHTHRRTQAHSVWCATNSRTHPNRSDVQLSAGRVHAIGIRQYGCICECTIYRQSCSELMCRAVD